MTLDQVKSDLKEIQYYYAKQKELDGASRTIGASKITKKVELLLSFDWDCSLVYVKRMTRKLRLFLKNQLEGGEEDE